MVAQLKETECEQIELVKGAVLRFMQQRGVAPEVAAFAFAEILGFMAAKLDDAKGVDLFDARIEDIRKVARAAYLRTRGMKPPH